MEPWYESSNNSRDLHLSSIKKKLKKKKKNQAVLTLSRHSNSATKINK